MAGREELGIYTPKMIHAGDFPIVTDSGTVKEGVEIKELMPIAIDTDGTIVPVDSSTIANVYGIAAEDKASGEEVVYYLSGQFFGEAIVVPEGTRASDFKAVLRKIGIFLVDTENKAE